MDLRILLLQSLIYYLTKVLAQVSANYHVSINSITSSLTLNFHSNPLIEKDLLYVTQLLRATLRNTTKLCFTSENSYLLFFLKLDVSLYAFYF